ncbi:FxSxx-COOH system tetratricopeptide repeat protein [Streptomyces sp. LUP47B]|uniref:FxSxx-COOH system tetratricopeptide repeat protein n=1 Tax=Streptomyces sp. LUP47B TaxID=1890286 RepID=UPI000851652E|nr:FxSxx-COOH system tetratricopeptide repeat protein [Streptomyces sp. LUP47B]
MILPPSRQGRVSNGSVPPVASLGEACAEWTVHAAGEVVWLAAQIDQRLRAARAPRTADVDEDREDTGPAAPPVPDIAPDEYPDDRPEPGPTAEEVPSSPEPWPEPHIPSAPVPARPDVVVPSERYRPADAFVGPALKRSRLIEKGLRPLRLRLPSRSTRVLDEEATAESRAEQGNWLPFFQPAPERWLTLTLVVDSGASMGLWARSAREFEAALVGSGAFRDVRVCRWSSPRGGRRHAVVPEETDRHTVFVLTDMYAHHWRDGSAHRQLARWASMVPTAVVSTLPEHLWSYLSTVPLRSLLRSPEPAAANALWWHRPDDFALPGFPEERKPAWLPVPVLELTPDAVSQWARFVRREHAAEYTMRVLPVSATSPVAPLRPPATPQPLSAADHARRLRAQLSPVALHLAQLGAAVPLNLTILQLLRRELLPEARPWHVAELLVSGLLVPTPAGPNAEKAPASARVDLEFATEGLRQELLAEGTRRDTALAMKVAFDHLSNAVRDATGDVLRQVLDLVAHPGGAVHVPLDGVRPWLVPALPALTALDGQHTAAAALLHERLRRFEDRARAPAPTDAHSSISTDCHYSDTQGNDRSSSKSDLVHGETPDLLTGEGAVGADQDDGGNVSVSGVQSDAATTRGDGARKPPPVWGNVPPRNRAFTGREQLLEDLHRRLQEGTTAVLPEALQGMGGVGKSQLAVEYVYRHLNEYQVIWWIPSEQSQQIRQVLVELARRLGLDVGTGEANTAVPAVIEALRVGEPYKNWLLVFDNAEVPEAVREFFPTNGPGRILVTSRNAQWATAARPLEVDVFAREESRQLLQLRAPNLDDDTADRLAETLGDLPLGIEQAAVWLSETGMPADEYLRLFEQQAADLMVSDPPPDYPLSVAAAWNVSLERLQKNHPAALQLLQVCAFFAPEPISRRLLTGVRDAPVPPELAAALSDPIRLSRAIREINRYALARINHATNTIQLHRLVQRVLINQMPDPLKEQMRNGAHRLLAKGDPGAPADSRQWSQYGELLPHVINSRAVESTDPWVRQLVLNEIQYMFTWGDHEGSRDLAKQAYETWRGIDGERAEPVLMAAKLYSDALRILGHYRVAYELDQRTHELMSETLGPEHEMTLEITGMLAWDLRMRGDFGAASELDRQSFETSRRLFGPNDLSTLIVAHRVALNLRLTGDFREALDLDQDTHRRKVEELGENALSTLGTLAGVVVDRQEAGEYIEARDQQQDVVGRYEYNYGPTNPTTVSGYRGLAVAERRAGRHEEAIELSAKALTLFRNRYGDNYPDTLAALLAHSVDVRHSGDLPRALELSGQGCKGYERLFGAHHPHTLGAQVNHAICLRLLGRCEEARAMNERLLSALAESLGEDHPNTLACATNLAADLYELGQVQASVELSTRTLDQSRRRLGEDHPAALATAVNLSVGLRLLGRTEEADDLHADTMTRYERALGADHPATAAAAAHKPANCDIDPMPL